MPSIPLSQGASYVAKLGPKFRAAAGRALYSAAARGVQVLQTELIPRATPSPVDRGLFRAGWRFEPHLAGSEIDGADLFNVEAHATFIERGVRAANVKAGAAMIRALAEWARRKGLSGADTDAGARQVAFAIARSMRRRGIWGEKGLRLLETLMKARMPRIVREEFAREAAAALRGK